MNVEEENCLTGESRPKTKDNVYICPNVCTAFGVIRKSEEEYESDLLKSKEESCLS